MGRGDLVQCGKCGLNFLHEEGLGKHMKRVHEPKEEVQASRYKCDRCAEEFNSKDGFKKHKLPEELRCEVCERGGTSSLLLTKCELNSHLKEHKTGKPKVCENCGTEFKGNSRNMKQHLELNKTVSCRRCGKVFPGSCPLQRHVRLEHGPPLDCAPPVASSPARVNAEGEPGAPLAKRRRASPPLKVNMNFQKREGREGVEPLDDTIPQELLLQPELLPGWAAGESVLGV